MSYYQESCQMLETEPSPVREDNLKWDKVTIIGMIIAVLGFAYVIPSIFRYYGYYNPATAQFYYDVFTIPTASLDTMKLQYSTTSSPAMQLNTVSQTQCEQLLMTAEAMLPKDWKKSESTPHSVHMWPIQSVSFSSTDVLSLIIKPEDQDSELAKSSLKGAVTSSYTGSHGIRRAGDHFEISVEGKFRYTRPDDDYESLEDVRGTESAVGAVGYMGDYPGTGLAFIKSIDDDEAVVLMIRIQYLQDVK